MRKIEEVPRLASGEIDFQRLEQKPSRFKWLLMITFPVVLFIATLFLGRFPVTVKEVLGIFAKNLGFSVDPFWTETAETVIMRVRLPRATMATLIGAVVTLQLSKIRFKHKKWLAPLGPILSNAIIVPIVLTKFYGVTNGFWFLFLTVGIGEVISCGILGMLLWFAVDKHKNTIFK